MHVKKKLYIAALLLFFVLSIGVVGYMNISGDSFINALYMTVITVSTVGFGLVHELSQSGKIFTIFLIFLSVFLYGYVLKVLSENIAIGTFFEDLKLKRMQKKIDSLTGHTIVCGYGRNGQQAVSKLSKFNQECVLVERDEDVFKQLDLEERAYVIGNATDDDVLEAEGFGSAIGRSRQSQRQLRA